MNRRQAIAILRRFQMLEGDVRDALQYLEAMTEGANDTAPAPGPGPRKRESAEAVAERAMRRAGLI